MNKPQDPNKILGAVIFSLILSLTGCANLSGIEPSATMLVPHTLAVQPDSAVFPQQLWWQNLGDKQLDSLVTRAIADNHSLKAVQTLMNAAQAMVAEADSERYPQVNANAESTRQHLSANSIYPPPLGGSNVTMSTARISAQWQIDWFGKQRAALDAAVGQFRAAQADAQAAQVILAASVAQQYFSLARLQQQQHILQQLLQNGEHHAQLVDQRVAAGLDSKFAQRQTATQLMQTRRDLSALAEQIALSRHAMAVLLGAEPNETDQLDAHLPDNLSAVVPDHLPAELLGHRADVVAARWRVESALQGVKEARADFYPNLNLAAFAGFESLTLSQWLKADSRSFGAGPAISLPIFDAGRLRAGLKGRSSEADAAIETYNQAILNSLREVADRLASRKALQTQLQEQKNVIAELTGSYDMENARYHAGLGNYISVLAAQNAMLQQRRILIDLQARESDNYAGLMLALGGGYATPASPDNRLISEGMQ
jgi:NodT family efflux transporter outer membrane factor (OMF) lipoprotein